MGGCHGQLISFLDDAHRRGVLRQVGAVYQFRHALLQDLKGTESPGLGSCSRFVFVDQPAQHIPALDTQAVGELVSWI